MLHKREIDIWKLNAQNTAGKSVRHLSKNLMAADKNKFSTVPSPEVTKSDSPSVIAFSDIQIDKKGGNSYFKQAADRSKSKKFFVSESFGLIW